MTGYFIIVFFLISCFFSCISHRYCVSQDNVQEKHIVIQEQKEVDSSILKYILPHKAKIDNDLNVQIAYTVKPLEKNKECNNLAQLVYESMKWLADSVLNTDVNYMVLINYGGLRFNIPQGNVTKKNIYEVMPFDNGVVILELNQEQKQILLSKTKDNQKLLLKYKGDDNAVLLVTSDYLYYGGDDCSFLKTAKRMKATNYFIRDAIIRYCIIKKQLDIACFY